MSDKKAREAAKKFSDVDGLTFAEKLDRHDSFLAGWQASRDALRCGACRYWVSPPSMKCTHPKSNAWIADEDGSPYVGFYPDADFGCILHEDLEK